MDNENDSEKLIAGDGNRQYKDVLFKFIFGEEERKEYALQLYNALNDTNYTDASLIKFVTLEDVVFLNYHNDVACMIDPNCVNLWEEQSAWNPNMALRFFLYLAGEWSNYLYATNQDPTATKKVVVPWPNCIVLYNGAANGKAVREISLKANLATKPKKATNVELTAMVYNINTKAGHELLSKCRPLYEYSWMIGKVQNYTKKHKVGLSKDNLTNAIKKMIEEIPVNFLLHDLMHQKRQEVIKMLLTEFDAKRHDDIVSDIRAEKIALKMLKKGTSVEETAEMTELPIKEVEKLLETIKK